MKPTLISVTISGPQGTGKSTLALAIAELLGRHGIQHSMDEPCFPDGAMDRMAGFPRTTHVCIETTNE